MPFSDTTHETAGAKKTTSSAEWTNIFQDWIKKAVESYPDASISCERSKTAAGNFVKGIVGSLNDSNFVIADLTGNKANVFYKLGIRHALRTGTIIITQHRSALPSDLQTYYCLEYSYTSKHHEYKKQFAEFKKQIHELIKTIVAQNFSNDSPVSDFLEYTHYSYLKKWMREKEAAVSQLEWIILIMKRYLVDMKSPVSRNLVNIDMFELDTTLTKFLNSDWLTLEIRWVRYVKGLLYDFRNYFLEFYEVARVNREAGKAHLQKFKSIEECDRLMRLIEKNSAILIKMNEPSA